MRCLLTKLFGTVSQHLHPDHTDPSAGGGWSVYGRFTVFVAMRQTIVVFSP
jgi:hypothetical protein